MRSREQLAKMMQDAEERNARMTASERAVGFGTPQDGPLELGLRTVVSALECAVLMEDWGTVAEGLALLGQITGYRPWLRESGQSWDTDPVSELMKLRGAWMRKKG
jgi:hypothetical protein